MPSLPGSVKRGKPAVKPGSVEGNHSSRAAVAGGLKQLTRKRARTYALLPYLALLRTGFTLPRLLPAARCALTAPFHPYPDPLGAPGGIFSVALSVGLRLPGVTWRPVRRSPDFPPAVPETR